MGQTTKTEPMAQTAKSLMAEPEHPLPPVVVYERWCKGCGICVEFCPRQVLEMGNDEHPTVVHPEQCNRCTLCEVHCPDFAIRVLRLGEKEPHHSR